MPSLTSIKVSEVTPDHWDGWVPAQRRFVAVVWFNPADRVVIKTVFDQEPYRGQIAAFLEQIKYGSYMIYEQRNAIYFQYMDDAVLCHMTFSG